MTRIRRIARHIVLMTLSFLITVVAGTLHADSLYPREQDENLQTLRQDLRDMVISARNQVLPSLVNIHVIRANYWNGKRMNGRAFGSGTVITPEGHVLTNYHVVNNGLKFICTLVDKQEVSAELVGEDPLTDLAVLKLNLDELDDGGASLEHATLGDSGRLEIGDTVMSMGSPWALSQSVTLGIVSNTNRTLTPSGDDLEDRYMQRDQRTGIFTRWIQHDSAISPGNSGGPLVNLDGEVVGVNTLSSRRGGDMGFAIPSTLASDVAQKLIEHGRVERSWLGWSLKPIKKSGFKEGVLVNSVVEGGPAHAAGIEAGDIVLGIDGEPVTVWFPEEEPPLLMKLAALPVGSEVDLRFQRHGKISDAVLTTEILLPDRGEEAWFRKWGIVAQDITPNMARNRRLAGVEGALVQSIAPGSAAQSAEPPLLPEDVIVAVDSQAVQSLSDLVDLYKNVATEGGKNKSVVIEFLRRGRNQLTLLTARGDSEHNFPREIAKAWIGIAVQPVVPELARHLETPGATGFRITRVYPEANAAESGLQVGDIIQQLNGMATVPLGTQNGNAFHRQVRMLEIGQTAELTLLRGNETVKVLVKLERSRRTTGEVNRLKNEDFGLTVRPVTFFDRDENHWSMDAQGVLVEDIEIAGWAQLGGLRRADLILQVAGKKTSELVDYREIMATVTEERPERVTFVVLRGAETRFQYVDTDWLPQTSGTGVEK